MGAESSKQGSFQPGQKYNLCKIHVILDSYKCDRDTCLKTFLAMALHCFVLLGGVTTKTETNCWKKGFLTY